MMMASIVHSDAIWLHKNVLTIVTVDCDLLSALDGNALQTFNVSHGNSTIEEFLLCYC